MFRRNRLLTHVCIMAVCLSAVPLFAQDSVPLPVKKVELYKNGMGYFEHLGSVNGSQDVTIALPSSRLNDILKSLTVLDLDGGRIDGVHYDSAAPLSRRMAEFRINLDSNTGLVDFLNSIRGAGIEFQTSKGVVKGKLVGTELRRRTDGSGAVVEETLVNILTDTGEIRMLQPESIGAFKLTDPDLADDFGRYLDLLNTTHQRDVRNLNIGTSGNGERQIFIGYTSESPIWKTTYRIVLDPEEKPLLQGWAIVDNTTPMDWKDVSLSLIAGAPISFIQDLSQPIYARRPVVPMPQGVQVTPQVSEATVQDENILDNVNITGGIAGNLTQTALPSESEMLKRQSFAGVDSRAIQIQQDGLTINDVKYRTGVNSSTRVNPNMASEFKLALSAVDAGIAVNSGMVAEQFEYRMDRPVTILRNESALLPIIQEPIEGEKVSLFTGNEAHPRLAFWLKNSGSLMLDGGAVTLIDSNAFAGEGLIETMQPGEKRLISYALDLGTIVSTNVKSNTERVERVVINQGTITMHAKMVVKKTYTIRNNNDAPRTVILEHPIQSDGKLVRPTPVETSSSFYRFRVEVKPKSTEEVLVEEEYPRGTTTAVSSVTPDLIAVWIRERSIDREIEKSLETITDKMQEIRELNSSITSLDNEQREIFSDQERIRGNLERLGREPEENALRQRYVEKLGVQEDRLAAMRSEREQLEASRDAAQKQLDNLIQTLSMDKRI